jgi:hypothetical protein
VSKAIRVVMIVARATIATTVMIVARATTATTVMIVVRVTTVMIVATAIVFNATTTNKMAEIETAIIAVAVVDLVVLETRETMAHRVMIAMR